MLLFFMFLSFLLSIFFSLIVVSMSVSLQYVSVQSASSCGMYLWYEYRVDILPSWIWPHLCKVTPPQQRLGSEDIKLLPQGDSNIQTRRCMLRWRLSLSDAILTAKRRSRRRRRKYQNCINTLIQYKTIIIHVPRRQLIHNKCKYCTWVDESSAYKGRN